MAWKWLTSLGGYRLCKTTTPVDSFDPYDYSNVGTITVGNTPVSGSFNISTNKEWTLPKGSLYFHIQCTHSEVSYSYKHVFDIYSNGNSLGGLVGGNAQNVSQADFLIKINDETQRAKAYPILYWTTGTGWRASTFGETDTQAAELYRQIKNNLPVWESVSSLSGNGKTYNLATIKSANINYGESVTGASSSAFNTFNKNSLVSKMINDVLYNSEKVTVKYSVPSGTYSYIKLVYKKGSIPSSYSDGTAINITQSSTEQEISGLADGGTYWFVIFTDKSMSEPKKIKTEDHRPPIIWKTTDVNHNKSVNWNTDITSLSEYYLTDWILCQKQGNGNFITQLGADYGYGRRTLLETGCFMLIPMERITVSKIRVKAGFTYQVSGQYATLILSLAYIEDGVLKFIDNMDWSMIVANEVYPLQQFEYVIQNPHYVDYLAIRSCDYQWAFENLEFI